MEKQNTPISLIRQFFGPPAGREVSMAEIKALSSEERFELGSLIAAELGVNMEPGAQVAAAVSA